MRDRRDYVIAALAAALLFSLGLLVGQYLPGLPAAQAQDGGTLDPEQPLNQPGSPAGTNPGPGITINPSPNLRPGAEGRTVAPTASDSDSNQRFVAVTCPIGSGESVLFLIDSKNEQIATYRFKRREGLEFLAARKIDVDLKITGYQDISKYSHEEMKRLYARERARAAAEAVRQKR